MLRGRPTKREDQEHVVLEKSEGKKFEEEGIVIILLNELEHMGECLNMCGKDRSTCLHKLRYKLNHF